MATFTTEEIELLKSKGNDYCKRVWLGLYDGTLHSDPREEQTIRDFMVDKYERKRYYIDPQNITTNPNPITTTINGHVNENNKNTIQQKKTEQQQKLVDFVADFSSADIFNGVTTTTNNNINNNNNTNSNENNSTQSSFANFDNNPVFNNSSGEYYDVVFFLF